MKLPRPFLWGAGLSFSLTLALAGCELELRDDDPAPRWQDLGGVRHSVHMHDHYARPMLRDGDAIWLGTPAGLKKKDLRSGDWQNAGPEGFSVYALAKAGNTLFAAGVGQRDPTRSLYRSSDAGRTWVSADNVPTIAKSFLAETIYDIVVSPKNPQLLYFNFSGASIGVSSDGGKTVKLVNDQTDTFFGYACVLHFVNDKADKLFQGCEAPLDDAWVAEYRLNASTPNQIGEARKIAAGWTDTLPKLDNRRPNSMASHRTHGDALYVGVEGGLVRFDGDAMKWLYKSPLTGTPTVPYAYIRAIGLDRDKPQRVFMGGLLNGDNRSLQFHVTEDGGKTSRQIPGPEGLKDPHLIALEPDGPNQWLVLIAHHPSAADQRLQLFRYRHQL